MQCASLRGMPDIIRFPNVDVRRAFVPELQDLGYSVLNYCVCLEWGKKETHLERIYSIIKRNEPLYFPL